MEWVKSHQDTCQKPKYLSREARMNIVADRLAGEYLQQHKVGKDAPRGDSEHFEAMGVSLVINGIHVTSNHKRSIRDQANGINQKKYLMKKHGWNQSTWNSIDWPAFARCMWKTTDGKKQVSLNLYMDGGMWVLERVMKTNLRQTCFMHARAAKAQWRILTMFCNATHHRLR